MAKVEKILLRHVEEEVNGLDYGSVTIEVRGGRAVDVVTERRVRFEKESTRVLGEEKTITRAVKREG